MNRATRFSRRAFLFTFAGAIPGRADRGEVKKPDFFRYTDRATELPILRLTNPAVDALLPAYPSRFITRNRRRLVFSQKIDGRWQLHTLDFQRQIVTQLTEAKALCPDYVFFQDEEERILYWADQSLLETNLRNLRTRTHLQVPGSFSLASLALSERNDSVALALYDGTQSRVQVVELRENKPVELAAFPGRIDQLAWRSNFRDLIVRQGNHLYLLRADRTHQELALTPEGELGEFRVDPKGDGIIYLDIRQRLGRANTLRYFDLRSGRDELVAITSQYVTFNLNANGTVFIGASSSRANPFVLIMLRLTRRELVICEHLSRRPVEVRPAFSPDSQRVVFQSDRDGKMALYWVDVSQLVERTET